MTPRHATLALRVGVVLILTMCDAGLAVAHEMGASRAQVVLRDDGTFAIDILVDPQNLLAQLALADRASPPELDNGDARVERLRASLQRLAEGVEVYFDNQRVTLTLEYQMTATPALAAGLPAGAGDAGTLHASGSIPPNARRFSFAYRWTYGAMPLVVHRTAASSEATLLWVGARERSTPISLAPDAETGPLDVARRYLWLGFTHILPLGLDHILFVLGLFFLSAGWRALVLQVSTFTIAHTLTLGLTMLGIVSVSPSIVEPLIALSIAYVAIENLTTTELRRSRLVLIFGFGLLHGMGFAGVLTELGLPASRFPAALLSFNVGVEFGQLTVLAAATLMVAGWPRREASFLPLVARPASVLIAAGGLLWTIQRVVQ